MSFFRRYQPVTYDGLVLTCIDFKAAATATRPNRVEFSGEIEGATDDDSASFIINVRQINRSEKSGKRLFEADTITVQEAKQWIKDNSPADGIGGKPLFCVHGFNVQPGSHIKECNEKLSNFKKGHFCLVPVIWPSKGGLQNYWGDRDGAIGAGKAFKNLANYVGNAFPSKSLLCHSMGNRVLRFAADARFNFDNIFMAAADVNGQMFTTKYIAEGEQDEDDTRKEDGIRIYEMLSKDSSGMPKGKIYALYNNRDYALAGSSWIKWRTTRLGQLGSSSSGNDIHPLIQGHIEDKDCGRKLWFWDRFQHSYHFYDFAVEFYEEKFFQGDNDDEEMAAEAEQTTSKEKEVKYDLSQPV